MLSITANQWRSFITVCVLLGLACNLCAQSSFTWPNDQQAALSLSFDDARLSNVDVGVPLFKEYDVQVTYYVNPDPVRLRLAGWKQAVADGHEIGNHTDIHPCTGNFDWSRSKALESYSLESMRDELTQSNHEIAALLGVTPKSFAYTCGHTYVGRGRETRSYVPLIAELFTSGRGWLNEATNDPYFVDLAQVQGIEMDGKDFEKDIKPILEKTKEQGTWVVLAGHEIGSDNNQTTETTMLRTLFDYLDKSGDIWLTTVGEAADYVQKARMNVYQNLGEHLSFYASFDHGIDADFARGDKKFYSANSQKESNQAIAGPGNTSVSHIPAGGRYGGALQFKSKTKDVVFYRALENTPYQESSHGGAISLWLSLDPEVDLQPGYCDPIQITDVGYNDAAYWIDFTDKNPRLFRMGVFGDLVQWNPDEIGPDENPTFKDRLVVAKNRPFAKNVWTHIVISYENMNGEKGGMAQLFVNGIAQGETRIPESFTWDYPSAKIFLGLNYVGLMDDLAIFDRSLAAHEVQLLFQLEGGVRGLIE